MNRDFTVQQDTRYSDCEHLSPTDLYVRHSLSRLGLHRTRKAQLSSGSETMHTPQ